MIENFMESSKYAQNLFKIRNGIIQDIKNESLDENVPIITDEVLNYMIFTARNIKARNILEIGTATGYSGLFLAQIANENSGFLTTMEIDEIRYGKAVENFKKLGLFEKNKMIFGDALEEISKLDKNVKYDFIFIDASKGQYLKFFEMSYELLNEIPKRYKTIVKRLKEFIEKLNEEYNFVLLPFGDGVGIVKK